MTNATATPPTITASALTQQQLVDLRDAISNGTHKDFDFFFEAVVDAIRSYAQQILEEKLEDGSNADDEAIDTLSDELYNLVDFRLNIDGLKPENA